MAFRDPFSLNARAKGTNTFFQFLFHIRESSANREEQYFTLHRIAFLFVCL